MVDCSVTIKVTVAEEPFDLQLERREIVAPGATGAVLAFLGLVRDFNTTDASANTNEEVKALYIEHYPGMTERALRETAELAAERWSLQGITLYHRVGTLQVTDEIVLVLVASSHRGDAFESANFIMDYLKVKAPFWKKAVTPRGESWVEARDSDVEAQQRWL